MNKTAQGFTLVEMAIVLMIIGLLLGGILRGQELLNNSRIKTTITQVHAYSAATTSFRDQYSQLPGDYSLAEARLPGCLSPNYCEAGDGDNIIGAPLFNINIVNLQTGAARPGLETTLFWKHLSLAHLISGVTSNANPANPDWGHTHPRAKIGGGFMVVYGKHHTDFPEGTWVMLANNLTGSTVYNPGHNPLTPVQARQIDTKMDDGMADRGDVGAPDQGECDYTTSTGEREYHNHEQKTCVLIFRII